MVKMEIRDPIISIKEKSVGQRSIHPSIYVLIVVLIIGFGAWLSSTSQHDKLSLTIKWPQKKITYQVQIENNCQKILPFFIAKDSYKEIEIELENSSWKTSKTFKENTALFAVQQQKIEISLINTSLKLDRKQFVELAKKVRSNTATEEETKLFSKMFSQAYNKSGTSQIEYQTILQIKLQ